MEDNSSNSYVTGKKLFVLWVIFLLYLLFGGLIFSVLEKGNEDIQRKRARITKKEFIYNYTCLDASSLEDLISTLLEIQAQGVDPRENVTGPSKWDFTSSLFFSGTVVTTIGYGKIAPKTYKGQVACILYAIIGIPFTGWLLSVVGDFYHCKFHSIWSALECFIRKYFSKHFCRSCALLLILVICYFFLLIVPALFFMYLEENWSFHIAHYYSFITLTTIGFGDYVASNSESLNDEWKELLYEICLVVWYTFGLGYISIIITGIGRKEKHIAKMIKSHIKDKSKKLDVQLQGLRKMGSKKVEKTLEPSNCTDDKDEKIFTMSGQSGNIVL
ncbi:potassium channel subfamily K member 16-like isoform X2 [Anneissia japonica]|uniref:potassium channel subfamily K member 16-like isoform X2 n=1 Tax=Anneissia japonica TaxID=1529436 RepID=UPI0014256F6A|nr:potassium channel subfamily K member 16-like isoform X2 [Anneissia japonica]